MIAVLHTAEQSSEHSSISPLAVSAVRLHCFRSDKGARYVVPPTPCSKPSPLDPVEDRTHVEPIPFIGLAGQVYVALSAPRIIFPEHHIDESFIWQLRVERHFVVLKSLWRFSNRALRPVNDESRSIGIEPGNAGTSSGTGPRMKIHKNLRIGDFNRSLEIGTLDSDADYVLFRERESWEAQHREHSEQCERDPHAAAPVTEITIRNLSRQSFAARPVWLSELCKPDRMKTASGVFDSVRQDVK